MAGAAVNIVLGFMSSQRANDAEQESKRLTELKVTEQKQTTAEEIRRKQYNQDRDISSIEAEIAAGGISATGGGLRGGNRTTSTVDAEISDLKSKVSTFVEAKRINEEQFGGSAPATTRGQIDHNKNVETLADLEAQRETELKTPWNKKSGIFGEYLAEKEKVHFSEIGWMRKTGLSNVRTTSVEGRLAERTIGAARNKAYGQVIKGVANWWDSSRTPDTTTTTDTTDTGGSSGEDYWE